MAIDYAAIARAASAPLPAPSPPLATAWQTDLEHGRETVARTRAALSADMRSVAVAAARARDRGASQRQIADVLGISQQAISKLLRSSKGLDQ
jgi:DNA-directed RNA polymerase specialized sigma24 family protein